MGKVCDNTCLDCIYFQGSEFMRMCCYCVETGKRRPCDPGKGCTVKIKRKRKLRTVKDRKKEREHGK
jgi:hypothetical protein